MGAKRQSTTIHSRRLTSREAARFLGVSEASVKRWADSGLIPAEKTAGGHRRFRPEDVSVWRRDKLQGEAGPRSNLKQAIAPGKLSRATTHVATRRRQTLIDDIFQMLTDGNVEELSSLLATLNLNGFSVSIIADQFFCPAMRRIGDLWCSGEMSVAEEHIATQTAMEGLQRLRTVQPIADTPNLVALCGSGEGDFHDLPVQLAAATLEANGLEVFSLGSSTPFFAFTEAMNRFHPRLVCVAATIPLSLEHAARDYEEFQKVARQLDTSIVLGGAGFKDANVRERLPAHLYAESFEDLDDFVDAINQSES